MPKFDGTGPSGCGPGTGWGMGSCGCGIGWRRGRGFGWRRFYTQKEEREILREEAVGLEQELKVVKERLAELEDQK